MQLARQQTTLNMLLDHSTTHRTSNDPIARIFKKIDNESQLRELDGKLEVKTFKSNLVRLKYFLKLTNK